MTLSKDIRSLINGKRSLDEIIYKYSTKFRKPYITVVKRERINSRYKAVCNMALWVEKHLNKKIGFWLERKLVSAWFDTYK